MNTSVMDAFERHMHNEQAGYSCFDADYTPTPEAIDVVNQVFSYIEDNPEKWNQYSYGNPDSPTNCFMGLVCRLNGCTPISLFGDYHLIQAMDILGMDGDDHEDRANYIADFIDVGNTPSPGVTYVDYWRPPTLDEMRERVSIAMNHDFRKSETRALNDPTVDCCKRDAADCDC